MRAGNASVMELRWTHPASCHRPGQPRALYGLRLDAGLLLTNRALWRRSVHRELGVQAKKGPRRGICGTTQGCTGQRPGAVCRQHTASCDPGSLCVQQRRQKSPACAYLLGDGEPGRGDASASEDGTAAAHDGEKAPPPLCETCSICSARKGGVGGEAPWLPAGTS